VVIEQVKAHFERGFFKLGGIILVTAFCASCASSTALTLENKPRRNPAVAYDLFKKARKLSVEGNHEEAIKIFDQARQVDPKLTIAALEQAISLYHIGQDFLRMDPLLASAVQAFPNNPRARLYYGRVLSKLKRFNQAKIHWRKAIDLRPDFVEPRKELADLLEAEGTFPAAQEQLEAVLTKHPLDLQARIRLAELYARQKKFESAAIEIERAAVQAGRSAALFRKAAKWYSSAGEPQKASEMGRWADKIDPPRKQRDLRPLRKAR